MKRHICINVTKEALKYDSENAFIANSRDIKFTVNCINSYYHTENNYYSTLLTSMLGLWVLFIKGQKSILHFSPWKLFFRLLDGLSQFLPIKADLAVTPLIFTIHIMLI